MQGPGLGRLCTPVLAAAPSMSLPCAWPGSSRPAAETEPSGRASMCPFLSFPFFFFFFKEQTVFSVCVTSSELSSGVTGQPAEKAPFSTRSGAVLGPAGAWNQVSNNAFES